MYSRPHLVPTHFASIRHILLKILLMCKLDKFAVSLVSTKDWFVKGENILKHRILLCCDILYHICCMWFSITDIYFYCSRYLFLYLTHNGNGHFSLCSHTFLESLFFMFIFQERLTFVRLVGMRFVWPCTILVTKTKIHLVQF